ncbi:hypothetical protein BDP27DRAFT_1366597 [Rhodocollybia butyracea]|uniref:Uncharacterized protein n=1 Tax=Rhodocollybia butyracea TaxID=206335 RepID=A0A9P5PKZ2_9AGAR|nr:hypothetical protein BDP27DRAFT_1366597 [Rhodocollybia butyracea]
MSVACLMRMRSAARVQFPVRSYNQSDSGADGSADYKPFHYAPGSAVGNTSVACLMRMRSAARVQFPSKPVGLSNEYRMKGNRSKLCLKEWDSSAFVSNAAPHIDEGTTGYGYKNAICTVCRLAMSILNQIDTWLEIKIYQIQVWYHLTRVTTVNFFPYPTVTGFIKPHLILEKACLRASCKEAIMCSFTTPNSQQKFSLPQNGKGLCGKTQHTKASTHSNGQVVKMP